MRILRPRPFREGHRPDSGHRLQAALAAGAAAALLASCGGHGDDGTAVADGLEAVPGEAGTRAVRLTAQAPGGSRWCVFRTWPDERILVQADCDGAAVPVEFARGASGELLVFATAEADPYLYLLVYDARRNIPSGRIPGVVEEGIDVWRLDRRAPAAPARLLATALPLGGFDHLIEASADATGLTACGVRSCLRIDLDGTVHAWSDARLDGYEFVEVRAGQAQADVLLRSVFDGFSGAAADGSFHYAWARLGAGGVAALQPIARDCLPYGLQGGGPAGAPGWSCARSADDMARVLSYDLARMPAAGRMDYGSSNSEGRVAWSQAYYLNGLLELTGPFLPTLAAHLDSASLRARVAAEVALLARLADEPGPGYTSRRYSMRRSDVTFALHLGRIARTLALAAERGVSVSPAALGRLGEQVATLQGTVEQPAVVTWHGGSFDTLRYARGSDFWCDGANVPHNYVTAYAHGLLALRGSEAAVQHRATALLAPLLQFEPVANGATWNYWWGPAFDGWSGGDGVSVNTPAYPGYRDRAHISYRSLDAIALLRLAALSPAAVPAEVVANIRRLVAQGSLLPWVGSELARAGMPVALDEAVAYRHARSAGAWEIEAQVWALERLAAGR